MDVRHLASALGLMFGSFALISAAAAPAPGDAANGKRLFMGDRCYACHGTQGAGGGIAGPRLAPNPLPFQGFLMQLRHPANRMPPYRGKVLSDAEAADIYAYLKSIPRGRPAGQIPLLNRPSKPRREGHAPP
jgi:mono/diheme cytochrome c family protein